MPSGLPSGQQFEIHAGDHRAVVAEVGAGLRSYTVAGRDVLDGYASGEMAGAGRGQVLIPWPNRIEDGVYEFRGKSHQLPLDEVPERNAIHGLVRWASWAPAERDAGLVVLEHTLHPQPGYPFSLALRIEYALADGGLRVTTTATNVGIEPCPYGSGMHPYLTHGTRTVDSLLLRAPGRSMLQTDDRGIPTGRTSVEGTEYDFREPRPMGGTKLDHAFTDLERADDGLARVELQDPDDDRALALWVDESYPYLQLFTGDSIPEVDRRSLAVEPMTCAPNAFRTGEGLLVLEPGEATTSTWGIRA
jgi:aldose 1-epimerase